MTYLSILLFPTILSWLFTKLVETSHDLSCCWEWNHVCLAILYYPRKHRKKKKARRPSKIEGQAQRKKSLMLTYLLPLALISFKVGVVSSTPYAASGQPSTCISACPK